MAEIRYADVIREMNQVLKDLYPNITRYGNDSIDKAVPPYFFVECIPTNIIRQTRNMLHKGCTVMITYVQKIPNQVDNLDKVEVIEEALGMAFKIHDRTILVTDYDHEYIGEQNNILQISFSLDWWENTQAVDTGDKMEHLHTTMIAKGD